MTIYLAIIFALYFLWLIILMIGWSRATRVNPENETPAKLVFISVVVAMRNEKDNIGNLLQSLSVQNYPQASFEVIVVDDHSEDDSDIEAKKWSDHVQALRLVSLAKNQRGKKAAISMGVSLAQGEIIATTDADCTVSRDWLGHISNGFHEGSCNMLIGTVIFKDENDFFRRFQSTEFASVMGTGVSLSALSRPVMCNGANLAFRKKTFVEVEGYIGNEHLASGDDEFLMRKVNSKFPKSIRVLNTRALVTTRAQGSLKSFVQQRLRWASKWKANSSPLARVLAVFVFMVQVSWIVLLAKIVLDPSIIWTAILFLKVTIDLAFLLTVCHSLKIKFGIIEFTVLQFLYPVYVLYVGIISQLRNHQWKGREA